MLQSYLRTALLILILFFPPFLEARAESTCYGTTGRGRLENGWQLPLKGDNFVAYTWLGGAL